MYVPLRSSQISQLNIIYHIGYQTCEGNVNCLKMIVSISCWQFFLVSTRWLPPLLRTWSKLLVILTAERSYNRLCEVYKFFRLDIRSHQVYLYCSSHCFQLCNIYTTILLLFIQAHSEVTPMYHVAIWRLSFIRSLTWFIFLQTQCIFRYPILAGATGHKNENKSGAIWRHHVYGR